MATYYRRSDSANKTLAAGLLFFVAGVADFIIKAGDAKLLKVIIISADFAISAIFLISSFIINNFGDCIVIDHHVMTIQSFKEHIFMSDETVLGISRLPRHRKVVINLDEIENFAAYNGEEIYNQSFEKKSPIHLKMRPAIVDSFIGEMLISFVKVAPNHISTHYDHDVVEDRSMTLDEDSKRILSDARFIVINMKDKRQIILYLKGYTMIDGLSLISHITNKSHIYPSFPVKFPPIDYKLYNLRKWRALFLAIWFGLLPAILLMSIILFIQPEPNDIFFYSLKAMLIFLAMLFGQRCFLLFTKIIYRLRMRKLGITMRKTPLILSGFDLGLMALMMALVEWLLIAVNA